jgi:hypothetical protein
VRKDWEQLLLNPPPNGKLAAAKEFGIDLTLLIGNLRKTPDERVRGLQIAMRSIEEFSRQAKLWRKRNRDRTRTSIKSTD